ncbi:hypothetical protein [Nocardia harenae]|uniref:hypothetical protein n=1 Tax=Nocardia harenae TaxID=358707 RepID=UPI000A06A1D4|nr:hypothetical protein [Nocardia harenae]
MAATWAKAPDFADRPERRAEVRAQTVVDKRRYLEDGLTPLRCQACGTEVRVRKASERQTSIEWTEPPQERCPVFARLSEGGYGPGRPEGCESLAKTIRWAVEEGVLEVQ